MKPAAKKYLFLFAAWVAFIFTLTSIPDTGGDIPLSYFDKVAHFSVYLVAGFFFSRFLKEEGKSFETILILTVFVISLTGGIDELHQRWISGRVSSIYDWIADMAGGTVGAFSIIFLDRVKEFIASNKNE